MAVGDIIFYSVYVLCIIVVVLHFAGFLLRRNMEWLVLAAAVAIFGVNILAFLKVI